MEKKSKRRNVDESCGSKHLLVNIQKQKKNNVNFLNKADFDFSSDSVHFSKTSIKLLK